MSTTANVPIGSTTTNTSTNTSATTSISTNNSKKKKKTMNSASDTVSVPSTCSSSSSATTAVSSSTTITTPSTSGVVVDYGKLINVNITSSSPPDTDVRPSTQQHPLAVAGLNEVDDIVIVDDNDDGTIVDNNHDLMMIDDDCNSGGGVVVLDQSEKIIYATPPKTSKSSPNKLTITRANSAKNPTYYAGSMMSARCSNLSSGGGSCCAASGGARSRKSSTVIFQEPTIIKRPNSTIGIPNSMRDSLNMKTMHQIEGCGVVVSGGSGGGCAGNFQVVPPLPVHHHHHHLCQAAPVTTTTTTVPALETPDESDVSISGSFNPGIVREKASSLTLPDQKLHYIRKGSSNPFLNTENMNFNKQDNYYKTQRKSIILNGNILHSISPIIGGGATGGGCGHHHSTARRMTTANTLSGNQLSVYVQDNQHYFTCPGAGGSGNMLKTSNTNNNLNANNNSTNNIMFNNNNNNNPRGSTISSTLTNHRSSYIGDEEHYHLQQQYFATTGRKDTIISIGKNFQIQFKSPSTHCLSWRYRTGLEKFLLFLLMASLVFLLVYIYLPYFYSQHNQINVCTSMECVKTAASLLNAMDLNADPCEDFFQFACGNWVKKHIIPEDRSSLSTFEVMADDLQIILKDLLEQVPNSADNSATLKAKRFYQSCMNTQKIDEIGVEPIMSALKEVGGWPVLDSNWNGKRLKKTMLATAAVANGANTNVAPPVVDRSSSPPTSSSTSSSSSSPSSPPAASSLPSTSSSSSSSSSSSHHYHRYITNNEYMELTLENLLGKLRGDYNQAIIVEQYIGADDRNSSLNIIQFDQPSLGMPSREYFLKESPNKEKDAYLELMVDIAELLGAQRDYALEQMTKVLDFETELANITMPEADRHDTSAIYKKRTIKQLIELIPEIDWMKYLKNFMPVDIVDEEQEVVIYALDYYQQLGKLLHKIMQEDRKIIINYAIWRLMKSILPFLDDEFGVKRAKFRKILFGISADRTRWSQCVELVNKKMGMAVGAMFIKDNFDPKSKLIAIEMIHNIREAFNELLNYNDWMDDETRQVAKEKADAINERIGYPELLTNPIQLSKEYNYLEILEDQFLPNILNVFRYEAYKNLMKLGQPVDKDSWTTDPAVVNAFYSPNKNDIVFPAGILQPLFYSHYFPKSLNYGGIGVVIGHEITHGFDERGRQFDKNGNMKQWWNNRTIKLFRERAQCIIDQYSSYVLEDINANVNGRMTQGENIADNGGLKQAYRAFKKWEKRNGIEPLLPGMNLTHDQLFFLNYAQIWCGSMRPEDALNKIRSSVHSPGPIRVLGPLSNSYDFSNAYHCKVGQRMNPVKKCSVW